MKDERKTKAQLIDELQQARRLVAELTAAADEGEHPGESQAESQVDPARWFRSLAEHSPEFIYVADADGKVCFINHTLSQHTREDVVGKHILDFTAPPDQEVVRRAITAALDTGQSSQFETATAGPDGSTIHLSTRYVPLAGAGKPEGLIGVTTNTTARKAAQDAVINRERFLDRIIDQSPFATWIADAQGTLLRANPALKRFLNLTDEQLVGKYNVLEDPLVERQGLLPLVRSVFDEGETISFSCEWDGTDIPTMDLQGSKSVSVEATMFPIHNQDGELTNVVLNWLDVSDQRAVQDALTESEERHRALIENLSDLLIILDKDGTNRWNSPAVKQYGMTPDDAIGTNALDYVHPDDLERLRDAIDYVVSHPGESVKVDGQRTIVDNGTTIVQDNTLVYLPDTPGIHGIVATCRDVTAQQHAMDEKAALERQVQHAQKLESLGVLAGGIAHDFNNLLMAVLGNAGLALDTLSLMSPARSHLEEIERASKRAAELAKQMLAYSGKGKFVVQPINAARLIEEIAHLLEVSISKKAVLKYDFAENVPTFDGDVTQVRQIIMNLITNASEAIGDKSGVIALSTGAMECDRAYLDEVDETVRAALGEPLAEGVYSYFEVADTGCGMDAETLNKIFDPFFTTKFTGRGLGMSAVLGIVRGHKGAIKIYSEVGKGTTFKVLFPANEWSDNGLALSETTKLDPARTTGLVLIVDDEETVRAVVKQMFEKLGFTVITAPDGREGMKLFRDHAAERVCVLLDLTMPHMDGEQTFREMRRVRSDVSVILCSGYNEQDATQRFAGKGLAGFIQKPFNTAALREKLNEVLLE